jgi:site-specific DNA recombinase
MKEAVIYARVSSKDQEREGYSIPAQLKLLREYAERNEFAVIREFVDVETAKVAGRKQFGEMVRFVHDNPSCRRVIVEKTDRLYRNFRDYLTLEDLEIEIHLPKEGQVISKDSKSQAKLMHGLQVVMARNYIDNLREEVRKGMREKAEQGIYPSRPPIGYRNNKAERTIEIDPQTAPVLKRMFELYANGGCSLTNVRTALKLEFGKSYSRGYLQEILKNPFYLGFFVWEGKTYKGTHTPLVSVDLFENVQAVFRGHNKPKYKKRSFPYRGLLHCAHDGCLVTAEIKKERYVYYRCTGHRGKCDLPYIREEALGDRLGQILKNIHIPDAILAQLLEHLRTDKGGQEARIREEEARLQRRLSQIQGRLDQAYLDKLDGKISEEFWLAKSEAWRQEEGQVLLAIQALKHSSPDKFLDAKKILELANKAHFLYLRQSHKEKAKLLNIVLSNCKIDAASLYPTYRKPFDLIFAKAKNEEWCAQRDSNCCQWPSRYFSCNEAPSFT